jgi:hypothetical protein
MWAKSTIKQEVNLLNHWQIQSTCSFACLDVEISFQQVLNECLCSTQKLGKEDDIITKLLAVQPVQKCYKIDMPPFLFRVRNYFNMKGVPCHDSSKLYPSTTKEECFQKLLQYRKTEFAEENQKGFDIVTNGWPSLATGTFLAYLQVCCTICSSFIVCLQQIRGR